MWKINVIPCFVNNNIMISELTILSYIIHSCSLNKLMGNGYSLWNSLTWWSTEIFLQRKFQMQKSKVEMKKMFPSINWTCMLQDNDKKKWVSKNKKNFWYKKGFQIKDPDMIWTMIFAYTALHMERHIMTHLDLSTTEGITHRFHPLLHKSSTSITMTTHKSQPVD